MVVLHVIMCSLIHSNCYKDMVSIPLNDYLVVNIVRTFQAVLVDALCSAVISCVNFKVVFCTHSDTSNGACTKCLYLLSQGSY